MSILACEADPYRTLRRGQQRLYVHRGVAADPKPETTTPSEIAEAEQDEMGRLESVSQREQRGDKLIDR
jgi:phosphatidylinositol 3-kinase